MLHILRFTLIKIMKKLFLILLLIPALCLTSCVKQKNCERCKDREVIGLFKYLEKPYYVEHVQKQEKIVAIIYLEDGFECEITGKIPKEYESANLVQVRACLQDVCGRNAIHQAIWGAVYKLICIEKED